MTKPKAKKNAAGIRAPETILRDILEPLDYDYHSKRDIHIAIKQPEYSSVCPRTGWPDTGCITITYVPDRKIIELKSLKFYLLQYRNVGIFYENIVNRILEDLTGVLSPKKMTVTGEFVPRGGITTSVSATYEKKAKASRRPAQD
jgi:7-cyano-7-deazaguanine reductase